MHAVFILMQGMCPHAAHRADVFPLCGLVGQILSCGKGSSLCQGETFSGRGENQVRTVRHRLLERGVQHLPTVEFRQRGEAAVEGFGDAGVVLQVGKQQGNGRLRVAALRCPLQVTVGVLLDRGHGAEHPVVAAVVFVRRALQGVLQTVEQFACHFCRRAVRAGRGQAGVQVGFQPPCPAFHVFLQFPGIVRLPRRALRSGESATVARQLLTANVGKHGQHVVLQQGRERALPAVRVTVGHLPARLGKAVQEGVRVGGQRAEVV